MESQENDAEILAKKLVRTYTDDLKEKQLEGHGFNAVERDSVVEKDRQACSQELEYWLNQLNLEKSPS